MGAFQTEIIGGENGKTRNLARMSRLRILVSIVTLGEHQIFSGNSQPPNECAALGLVQLKVPPRFFHIRGFKVVNRKPLLIREAHVAILHFLPGFRIARPDDVIDRIHILEKRSDPFETISEFGRNWKQINAAALLEISKLRDLQSVEHHLPANPPRAERGSFPVIFLELDVVLPKVNSNYTQRLQIQLL